jgi:hypothetical protein
MKERPSAAHLESALQHTHRVHMPAFKRQADGHDGGVHFRQWLLETSSQLGNRI